MITRSAYKRACESDNNSDISQSNIIPPWCSSGKVNDREKPRKVQPWEIRSTYPLRENIWQYLYEDSEQSARSGKRKRAKCNCRQKTSHRKGKTTAVFFALLLITIGVMTSIWMNNLPKISLLANIIPKGKLVALLGLGSSSLVEECCHKMRYLAAELARIEQTLRRYERIRKTLLITSHVTSVDNLETNKNYITDISVAKSSDTEEYGGMVSLWGVVPLWRSTPPPETVLALRKPTPSDCWAFSGSRGEINIELPRSAQVHSVSIEHVRPDTAKSAPKNFIFYGILNNGTWVNGVENEYQSKGPAKQYYRFIWKTPLQRMVFRVMSNQGNAKYTCLYRVHIYGK